MLCDLGSDEAKWLHTPQGTRRQTRSSGSHASSRAGVAPASHLGQPPKQATAGNRMDLWQMLRGGSVSPLVSYFLPCAEVKQGPHHLQRAKRRQRSAGCYTGQYVDDSPQGH